MKKFSDYRNVFIAILLVIVVTFMTVGFAKYSKILSFGGTVTLIPDGEFEIVSILYNDSSNFDIAHSNIPTVSDNAVTFDLLYSKNSDSSEYYVIYDVEVENNSSYGYAFNAFNFNPIITGSAGGTGTLDFMLIGLENGDVIPAKSRLNFQIKLILTVSDPDQSYGVSGTTEMETDTKPPGSLLVGVTNSSVDLTGSNSLIPLTFEVINTYEQAISFTPKINNSSFKLTDSRGNSLSSMTINGNDTSTYTVYVSRNGDPHFYSDRLTIKLSLQSSELGNFLSNDFTALVDIYVEPDTDPPVISTFSIANSGTEGQINVNFSGSDNSNGDITYTVKLYNASSRAQVGDTLTVVSASTDPLNYSFTGIDQGTNTVSYYSTITASDVSGNSSSVMTSATISIKWRAQVTTHFTNITSDNNSTSVLIGSSYRANLSYSGNNGSVTDNTVKVLMGGIDITSTAYTANNDRVNINEVTGDIDITATGQDGGGCLVEGTLITLADGSRKLVEDIDYTDLLKVWNHAKGEYTYVYPIFLENELTSNSYMKTTFSDGTILKTVSYHSVFSVDKLEYVDVTNNEDFHIGTNILKDNGDNLEVVTVTNIEIVNEAVKYYMIVTTSYYNFFANDILNATGETFLLNMWGYNKDYKFLLDRDMIIKDMNNYLPYDIVSEFLDYYMYKGLRASDVGFLINNGYIPMEDVPMIIDYFVKLFSVNLQLPKNVHGKRYWMVSTSEDNVLDDENDEYLYTEGSIYVLPESKLDNFVSWYNTSDGKYYNPGDEIEIWTGTHFMAVYK